jgi:hypothetical protein
MPTVGAMDWGRTVCPYFVMSITFSFDQSENPKQIEAWLDKYMVESEAQAEQGLKSGAFDEEGYIRVDERMHRLCAPPFNPKKGSPVNSFIFWTKTSPTDKDPKWDKVVCIYSTILSFH